MTTQAQFQQLAAQGYNLIPVYRQRLADTDTPLSIFARLKQHQQAYLFESVEGGENWATSSANYVNEIEPTLASPVFFVRLPNRKQFPT